MREELLLPQRMHKVDWLNESFLFAIRKKLIFQLTKLFPLASSFVRSDPMNFTGYVAASLMEKKKATATAGSTHLSKPKSKVLIGSGGADLAQRDAKERDVWYRAMSERPVSSQASKLHDIGLTEHELLQRFELMSKQFSQVYASWRGDCVSMLPPVSAAALTESLCCSESEQNVIRSRLTAVFRATNGLAVLPVCENDDHWIMFIFDARPRYRILYEVDPLGRSNNEVLRSLMLFLWKSALLSTSTTDPQLPKAVVLLPSVRLQSTPHHCGDWLALIWWCFLQYVVSGSDQPFRIDKSTPVTSGKIYLLREQPTRSPTAQELVNGTFIADIRVSFTQQLRKTTATTTSLPSSNAMDTSD